MADNLLNYLVTSDISVPRVVEAESKRQAIELYREECQLSEEVGVAIRLASDIEIALARQCDERKPRRNVHYSLPRTPASSRQ